MHVSFNQPKNYLLTYKTKMQKLGKKDINILAVNWHCLVLQSVLGVWDIPLLLSILLLPRFKWIASVLVRFLLPILLRYKRFSTSCVCVRACVHACVCEENWHFRQCDCLKLKSNIRMSSLRFYVSIYVQRATDNIPIKNTNLPASRSRDVSKVLLILF